MSLKIISAPNAGVTLSTIYDFIKDRFGVQLAEKFLQESEKTIVLIAENPLMFRASDFDTTVRVGFISKQTSLFYRVSGDTIHLLFFRDNRQEPIFPLQKTKGR